MKPKSIATFASGALFASSIFGVTLGAKLLVPEDTFYGLVPLSLLSLIGFAAYWGTAFVDWFWNNWNKKE